MSDEASTQQEHKVRRKHHRVRWELLAATAAVAALGAAFAPGEPTGIPVFDVLERALLAAVVTIFAASSRRWVWLVLAGTATVLAGSIWGFVLGAVALGFAVHAAVYARRRDRAVGALVGALSIQVLLRTSDVGFFGFTALVTGIVVLLVMVSGYRMMRGRNRRRVRIVVGVVAVFTVLSTAGLGLTLLRAKSPIDSAVKLARDGLDAAIDADQANATTNWGTSHRYFVEASDILDSPLAKTAYVIPVLSQHTQLVTTAAGTGANVTAAAARAASVAPYRTLRASDGSFDLDRIESMQEPVAKTASSMMRARRELDDRRTPWLIDQVRDQAVGYRNELDRAIPEARQALAALQAAPELLGGNGPRRYLLLFANPAETRGMGGFIGAWAELEASDGHLELTRHGKMEELDSATDPASRKITGEPEYVRRYGYLQPARYIQNVSASPDFPTVARVAGQLYPQAGGQEVDGVMYIDPIALASLLKLTGPVKAEGIPMPLTSKNAADFLMHDQYIEFPGTTDRSDLLSNAAEATFEALTSRELPAVTTITDTLAPMVHERRLLASVTDRPTERYLESISLTGAFPRPDGDDLLSVRLSNGSANKVDYYLHQVTSYRAEYDASTGRVDGSVHVALRNDAPSGGQPTYVLGNPDTRSGRTDGRPLGSTTIQFSIYSALLPQTMSVNGKEVGIQVERELGSWVATQTVTIPPGETADVHLSVAGRIDPGSHYRLDLVPQAIANPQLSAIRLDPPRPGTPMEHQGKGVVNSLIPGATEEHLRVRLTPRGPGE